MIIVASVFGALIFVAVVAFFIVSARKSRAELKRRSEMDEYRRESRGETDGNGRTQHQRDFLNQLRAKQAEKKAKENERKRKTAATSHSHSGRPERYEKIVGSLGEVKDEGCDELDGVRLVEHDEAYCDDLAHFDEVDYDDVKQAVVIGEVINSPRFKQPFGKR